MCSLIVAIQGGCQFPKQWSGHWFQSGVPNQLTINLTSIETKGECVENQGDKFIIEDKSDSCYRCVVIHEKHPNVLQYKETYCDLRDSLDQMCGQITGDANLFSMFRAEPVSGPVLCPFRGAPFTFTYNRGSGECENPVSRVDSCTDESRLLLRYQACPDVHGTESTVEELVCLATWKDGSTRYLVGKLNHKMATSDEDRYRCFVYDQHHQHNHHQVYQVAQSGDATCNGLPSPLEGSRTMKLTTIENQHSRCRYPSFVSEHHHWHTLDHSRSYTLLHKNTTLKITSAEDGGQEKEMRVVCHNEHHVSHHQVTIVAHATSGCDSGYVCMVFYRREGHVIELQQSSPFVQVPEEACSPANFNPAKLPFITLLTSQLHRKRCPYLGRYTISGLSIDGREVSAARRKRKRSNEQGIVESGGMDSKVDCGSYDFESLVVGCSENSDTMEFYSSCDTETISAYICHGSWEDNGTSYLITSPVSRKSNGARRYCFIYTRSGAESGTGLGQHSEGSKRGNMAAMLRLSSVTESCHRNINPGVTGAWALNLTINGQCAETSANAVAMTAVVLPSLLFIMTLAAVISNMR